ncbi:MAG: SDR family oxidoreductase [Bacteroidales bacterium]|nr:SDR family oxidoreductase [Bacteroidales bacterium]
MSGIVDLKKLRLLSFVMQITGHLPELKQELKKLVRIKYFLPPGINPLDESSFFHFFNKRYPVVYYPKLEVAKEIRQVALITGATSGIGKAFACYFAAQGYDLLITGRRKKIIKDLADDIKTKYGVNIEVVIADLFNSEDISFLLGIVGSKRKITVLVNNAGYGMNLNFTGEDIDHQLAMIKVHINTPLMLIHKVLPQMIEQKQGFIINVSSLAAYFPSPGSAMYTSTKSFLKDFTESLHMDVRQYGIRVQCLCPGFTYSDFHRNLDATDLKRKQKLIPWMDPAAVVEYSIRSLKNGKVICIPGMLNRILVVLVSVVPRELYYWIATKTEKTIRYHKNVPSLACLHTVN